jgi:hypothetical protein
MKISGLVAELEGHQPDGPVMIQEIDAVSTFSWLNQSPKKMGRRS